MAPWVTGQSDAVPWQYDELTRLRVCFEVVWADDYNVAWSDVRERFDLDAVDRSNPKDDPYLGWDLFVRAEDFSMQEVQALMREHGPADVDLALVLWPFDSAGASLAFGDLVEHLDDLWHPGGDDVLVFTDDCTRVMVIDHEERLAFSGIKA